MHPNPGRAPASRGKSNSFSVAPWWLLGSHRPDRGVADYTYTWTVTVTVCVIEPDVALIVIVYVPGVVRIVVATVRVDMPVPPAVRVTDVGLRLAVGYTTQRPEQEIDVLKPIIPANPFKLVSVIVDVPDDPIWMLKDAGVALMLKSGGGGGGGEGVTEASFDRGPSPAAFTAETW